MSNPYRLSDAQLTLYNFGMFYHNLRELPPELRPDDRLLADDDALDRWFEQMQADAARSRSKKGHGRGSHEREAPIPQWSPPES